MRDYIHFYGSDDKRLFNIERYAMDADGVVAGYLNRNLPDGLVLDIGAGNGYTSRLLRTPRRNIVLLEPSAQMPEMQRDEIWVKGTAEDLPFHDGFFDGAYATWAYFLPGVDKSAGFREVSRVLKRNGKVIIIDNHGNDEFCTLCDKPIVSDSNVYKEHGFSSEVLSTSFRFRSIDDARDLMGFYFGESVMKDKLKLEYEYKVVAYTKTA